MSSDKTLDQSGLDNWLSKPLCPAVEAFIDGFNAPNSWVTDLSAGRQNSVNTGRDLRSWIHERVQDAERLLEEKDVDLEELKIKPGMDFDGPINKLGTREIKLQPGFRQAYETLLTQTGSGVLKPIIISGRGDNFLTYAVDDALGFHDVDWAGENGCIYHENGQALVFNGREYLDIGDPRLDYSKKIAFDREVWRKASEDNRKVIWASSFSPVYGTLSVEGEGINLEKNRTGIRGHYFYGDEYVINSDTDRIWDSIEAAADARGYEHDFERENPLIIFQDNRKNAEILSLALNIFSPGAELRFTKYKDKIAFYPCPEADSSFGDAERKEFMAAVTERANTKIDGGFKLDRHSDGWTDYMLSSVSKQRTTEKIREREKDLDKPEEALITYIGDRTADVFKSDSSLFFAQIGRASKNYCEEENIDHIPVNNATDYCLILAELMHRRA